MSMTSLKMTKKEAKEKAEVCCSSDRDPEQYPWGLRLDLNSETLDKLGIKKMPAVGQVVTFEAKAKVIGSRQSATEGSESRSIELQITDIDLEDLAEEEAEGEMTRDKSGPMANLAKRMKDM